MNNLKPKKRVKIEIDHIKPSPPSPEIILILLLVSLTEDMYPQLYIAFEVFHLVFFLASQNFFFFFFLSEYIPLNKKEAEEEKRVNLCK